MTFLLGSSSTNWHQDLAKKTEDEETKDDLLQGCEAAERVLQKANEAVNRDLLDDALEELIVRVDDWKSHKIESFGKLLLHGVYGVITGKSDQEKDVRTYRHPQAHLLSNTNPSPTV